MGRKKDVLNLKVGLGEKAARHMRDLVFGILEWPVFEEEEEEVREWARGMVERAKRRKRKADRKEKVEKAERRKMKVDKKVEVEEEEEEEEGGGGG